MKNKGITLIALVITIIVLLILAGVAIASLSGENGLFKRADEATEMHEEVAAREKLQMSLANMVADKLTNSEYNENKYLTNKLQEEGFVVNDNVVIVDGWQFEINRSVPEIAISLGKGEVNKEIKIKLSQKLSDDYVKSTIEAKIEYEKPIEYIQIAGEKKENVEKDEEGKYTVSKEVLANGKYSVYVRDTEGKYKYETIEVTKISENMSIDSSEKLAQFRDEVNKGRTFEGRTVQLTSDVDLEGSEEKQWIPIGTDTTNFKGTFDGNNHTIDGLYINNSESNQGLCKNIDKEATIKNLTINGEMTSDRDLGGFAAFNYGMIENCINNNEIISKSETAGGIAGGNGVGVDGVNNKIGFIIECINNGNISANSWACGGITALNGTHRK